MKVVNIHSRVVDQPKAVISRLFDTLASQNDQLLATDKWPAMYLDQGLKVGSKGGHGIIRYTVEQYAPGASMPYDGQVIPAVPELDLVFANFVCNIKPEAIAVDEAIAIADAPAVELVGRLERRVR